MPDVIDGIDTADEQVELVVKYPKQTVTNGNLIPKEDVSASLVVASMCSRMSCRKFVLPLT